MAGFGDVSYNDITVRTVRNPVEGNGMKAFRWCVGLLCLALALPVAVLTLFVLGLTAWVGFTIATIQVEAEPLPDATEETVKTVEAASEEA